MADQFTLDQLHGIETDPESEKKVSQSLQLPAGTYNSQPELQMTLGRSDKTGRAYARYFGQFQGTGEVAAASGKAGFGLSWEPRFKDDTGKADNMTKLFNQASKTYRLAHGIAEHAPVPVADVLQYLQKYSVAVRFMQGDDDNIAVAISSAKE